jgi:hypothetical protein
MKTYIPFIILVCFAIACLGQNPEGQKKIRMKTSVNDTASNIPVSYPADTSKQVFKMKSSAFDDNNNSIPAAVADTNKSVPTKVPKMHTGSGEAIPKDAPKQPMKKQ